MEKEVEQTNPKDVGPLSLDSVETLLVAPVNKELCPTKTKVLSALEGFAGQWVQRDLHKYLFYVGADHPFQGTRIRWTPEDFEHFWFMVPTLSVHALQTFYDQTYIPEGYCFFGFLGFRAVFSEREGVRDIFYYMTLS